MTLKLSSFNCRGIHDYVKRRKIFHYLRSIKSDIIFLQETHSSHEDEKFWKYQWGAHAWFSSFSSNSRGVAILISNSVNPVFHSYYADPDGRFLIVSVTINNLPVVLVNVYGPNNDDPDFFLNVFAKIDQFNQSSLIVGGDFNAVLGPLDYQVTKSHHSNIKACDMISNLMDEFNLCDIWRSLHPNLRQYTRHQQKPRVLSRLDYILVSDDLIDNCIKSKIIPGVQSDHSVVTLDFNDGLPSKGRGFWKLNTSYLHHDSDFVNLVKTKIQDFKDFHKDVDCNPNILWDSLKCTIAGVCMEYCARKKKERVADKMKLMDDIDKIKIKISDDPSNETLITSLESLEVELNKILDYETKGLIIRSRTKWMEEGERSSKYFCNLEKRSSQKKNIYKIINDNGDSISNQSDIIDEMYDFYNSLYTCNPNVYQNMSNGMVDEEFLNSIDVPLLDDNIKDTLDQPFTKKEFFDSLVSLKLNRTPGYDGFPVEFYIVFWPDISDMLIDSYNYSLDTGLMSQSQRNGIITLIKKKDKDGSFIKNYRPISLLTVDYKIFAKVLANRVKTTLHHLINSDQSGFLEGRNIGNNIRLILDVII